MSESELLLALASKLSPAARDLLLADSVTLQTRSDRTWEFITQDRMKNPLRSDYPFEPIAEPPDGVRPTSEEQRFVEELHFHESEVVGDDVMSLARWIGPDGIVVMWKSERAVRFDAAFEDGSGVAVTSEQEAERGREVMPDYEHIVSTGDLVEDYRLALEAVARRQRATDARPLYRFESTELDLAVAAFFWEHLAPLKLSASIRAGHGVRWAAEKVEGIARSLYERMMDSATERGREMVEERANAEASGIIFECGSCSKKSRVPYRKLGATGRCGHCGDSFATTGYPIDVASGNALTRLIEDSPIPVLVDFWAPWCGPCIAQMPALVSVAEHSDGKFVVARVNGTDLGSVVARSHVEAFPTMIKYVSGEEIDRHVGAQSTSAIRAFATAD